MAQSMIAQAKRLVVKVGTSTLTYENGRLNIRRIEALVKVLSDIRNSGREVLLVSSGAIGVGAGHLGLKERPRDVEGKQAAAAVGQCELMYTYDKLFTEYNHTVAQVLLTAADIEDKMRRHNVETTLQRLLQLGAIPVINENDTVSTAEIAEVSTLGDNDTLASIVAVSVEADLLVLLSDIEGLYTADPHKDPNATLIKDITYQEALQKGLKVMDAAAFALCAENHVPMVRVFGLDVPENLISVLEGSDMGTFVHP